MISSGEGEEAARTQGRCCGGRGWGRGGGIRMPDVETTKNQ